MLEQILQVLQNTQFWVTAAIGWIAWWMVGVALARLFFSASKRPLRSATNAAWSSVFLMSGAAATYAWLRWHTPMETYLLTAIVFLIPFVFLLILSRFEPRLASE